MKTAIGLLPVVLVLVAAACLPSSASASGACGKVAGYPVRVDKGNVSCRSADSIVRRFRRGKQDCGTGMIGACVVGRFHCRVASAGEEEIKQIAGYCYILKHPVPPARDFSFFRLELFKKAISIRVPSQARSARPHRVGASALVVHPLDS